MKKLILTLAIAVISITANAQTEKELIINLDQQAKKERIKAPPKPAGIVIKNGQEKTLYITKKGKYYYLQTSKKTGKDYKVYLKPEQLK